MTTLLALCCIFMGVQDPKLPPTALEGTWREPLLPGEKLADRLRLMCTGNKITLALEDQVLEGTFEREADSAMTSITITVTAVNGRALPAKRMFLGQFVGEGDAFDFRLTPTADTIALEVEPFTESLSLPHLPPAPPRAKGTQDFETLRKEFQELEMRNREYRKRYQEYQKKRQEWIDRVSAELDRARSPKPLGLAPVTFRLERVK